MSTRPENEAYASLVEARSDRNEEWPEPETSTLFRVLRQGSGRIIVSVIGHREPELAGEIAARALLRLRKFRGASQFSTWFYRLARNEAVRAVTESAPREEQFEEHFEPEAPSNVSMQLPQLLTLAERQLVLLVLRGESFERIGAILGCSKMAVSRRWSKLRAKLGDIYGRRDGPGATPGGG